MVNPLELGNTIRRLRTIRNISQESLAIEAKIDRRYMSDIETGKRNVSIDILNRLAVYFGVSVSYILEETEQMRPQLSSIEDVRQYLHDRGSTDSALFADPSFVDAIMGCDSNGQLVYSHRRMVESLVIHNNLSRDEAVDCIDQNTLRSIPLMGKNPPVIVFDL